MKSKRTIETLTDVSLRNCRASETTPDADCATALADKLPWMVEMLPPSAVRAAKRNARTHGKAQQEAVAHSIRTFGLIKPVVVDEQNRIVAGHVVWRAAKQLGLMRIPVIRVSHLSETELRAYALADNQLATKSAWEIL